MTARILSFPPRPPLRLVEAVAEALRKAEYARAVEDGYSPRVLPIPKQKPRVNCVAPVKPHTQEPTP